MCVCALRHTVSLSLPLFLYLSASPAVTAGDVLCSMRVHCFHLLLQRHMDKGQSFTRRTNFKSTSVLMLSTRAHTYIKGTSSDNGEFTNEH